MSETRILEDLNQRIRDLIAASPAKDVDKNLRLLLSSFFSRIDLVSREEFDVQAKVLVRTREKLAALEARLQELEKRR